MCSSNKKPPVLAISCGIIIFAIICVSAGLAWHFLQPSTIVDSTDEDEPTTAGLSVAQMGLFVLAAMIFIGLGLLYHRKVHLPAHRTLGKVRSAAQAQAARQESFLLQLMENQPGHQGRPSPN